MTIFLSIISVYICYVVLAELVFGVFVITKKNTILLLKYGEPVVIERGFFMRTDVILQYKDETFYYDKRKTSISCKHSIILEDLDSWSADVILRFITVPISTTLVKLLVKKYKRECWPIVEMINI